MQDAAGKTAVIWSPVAGRRGLPGCGCGASLSYTNCSPTVWLSTLNPRPQFALGELSRTVAYSQRQQTLLGCSSELTRVLLKSCKEKTHSLPIVLGLLSATAVTGEAVNVDLAFFIGDALCEAVHDVKSLLLQHWRGSQMILS